MKQKFEDNSLYIVLPSKVKEDRFVQNPQDITIVNKTKENSYIDFLTKEEIYIFTRDELTEEKKYIRVFSGDINTLRNYIFSLKTDHIKNINDYMEAVRSIDSEYKQETLENILKFLKEEIKNIDYSKSRKIARGKRRTRKK